MRAGRSLADGARSVLKAPFRGILGIAILVDVVSQSFGSTIGGDALLAWVVLFSIGVYLDLALTLAAGNPDPERSADRWIKGAFRRRCFLRYLVTGLLTFIIVILAGFGGLIVGGVIAGGWLSLAQPASAIERRIPIDALRRSLELARPALVPLSIVFSISVLVPTCLVQVGYYFGWDKDLGAWWLIPSELSVLLSGVGTIALARAFVALGGNATPAADQLAPRPAGPPPP
jgi:hypothetical protein